VPEYTLNIIISGQIDLIISGYLDTILNLNWSDIFGKVAITCFFLSFIIFLIVGWAHGGKYNMSPWDPALKNKISPLGIKCLIGGGILILLAILFGIISTLLI